MYVAGTAAALLLDFMGRQGLELPALRQQLLDLAAQRIIPFREWWRAIEAIRESCVLPALGLEIGRCIRPHHIGVVGYVAMYSGTAMHALMRFNRLEPLLHNLTPSAVSVEGDDVVLTWDHGDSTLVVDELLAAGLYTLLCQFLEGCEKPVARVEFRYPPPPDTSPYEAFFGLPPVFNALRQAIHLPVRCLNQSLNRYDPFLVQLLEQQAEAALKSIPTSDALLQSLQQQIMSVLQDGQPELAYVAERLGISERSLYRQLRERGLRYKQVLNSLRYELAKDYLRNPLLALPEIALLLGFAEQSAFSRAFKSWSGMSPLRYRRRQSE
ncbi:AraC-like DNA-binding protein [Fluviicoccus keumensis]|uniref:AraC-like DNA-binding protein n=2 Tax=Fluviicoccus keumensis TaxID=1435465 RepID=A0A4Q7YP83_9GAMM|nr:AraC-like DNA-binding protein [Fluviicoccus keumensis]